MNRVITPKFIPTTTDTSVLLSGSKYVANRLVCIAALAKQSVKLGNVVDNDDINTAVNGLNQLGYWLSRHGNEITSSPRTLPLQINKKIYTHHSGTFSRFISAIAALDSVVIEVYGSDKMNTRPMQPLFEALQDLGVLVTSCNGFFPAKIQGPISRHQCEIDASISSQFVSGLLIAAGSTGNAFEIRLKGDVVSDQYIDMTIELMKQFGVSVQKNKNGFFIERQKGYCGGEFSISPDPVSSSYFLGLSAITGQSISLPFYDFNSVQGEAKFYQVLEQMNCEVERKGNSLVIKRTGPLLSLDVDMSHMPDVVQTLAAVAAFADGTTKITNIAHLAYKESNRIVDTATELLKVGIEVEYGSDYLTIKGDPACTHYHGTKIDTYDDHRMAMSMALLGAKIPNIIIKNSDVVAKSFPDYFEKMNSVGLVSSLC